MQVVIYQSSRRWVDCAGLSSPWSLASRQYQFRHPAAADASAARHIVRSALCFQQVRTLLVGPHPGPKKRKRPGAGNRGQIKSRSISQLPHPKSVLTFMSAVTEQHFLPIELAKLWGLSPSKIRRMFEDEPGVLRIGEPSRKVGRALKRSCYTMRIPESVAQRVHARLTSRKPY